MSPDQIREMCVKRTGKPPLTPDEKRESVRRHSCNGYRKHKEARQAYSKAYYEANKVRIATQKKEYVARTREQTQERINAWKRAHPEARHIELYRRRSRQRNAYIEDVDRRIVLERAGGICGWCEVPVDPANFHVDHIVALVHGGEHSYANTQPVHPACNYEKRTVLRERAA